MNIQFIIAIETIFGEIKKRIDPVIPLPVAYLASLCEKSGHRVNIIDQYYEGLTDSMVLEQVRLFKPDLVCFAGHTFNYSQIIKIAAGIKKFSNAVIILDGGEICCRHITDVIEKKMPDAIDIGVVGEEDTIIDIISALEGRKKLSDIPGIIFQADGRLIRTGVRKPISDLDILPFPAFHLFDLKRYSCVKPEQGRYKVIFPIMMSRGCPYKCIFCSQSKDTGIVRSRSTESVIAEITHFRNVYHEHIYAFAFLDLILSLDRTKLLELSDKIISRNLNKGIYFKGQTRADFLDLELAKKMREAGFIRLIIGAESSDEEILKKANKQIARQDIQHCAEVARKAGIDLDIHFILGLPGETRITMRETIKFARKLPCFFVSLNIATPYPGTKLYDLAKTGEYGLRLAGGDFSRFQNMGQAVMYVGDISPFEITFLHKIYLVYVNLTFAKIVHIIKFFGLFFMCKQLLRYLDCARRIFARILQKMGYCH